MTNVLSTISIPQELMEDCIKKDFSYEWNQFFQTCIDKLPKYRNHLRAVRHIDMSHLATAHEVRSGKALIASPFALHSMHPCYNTKDLCFTSSKHPAPHGRI